MNIKNQLQELLATDPMTYDTICKIKALLADPPTAKPSFTEKQIIKHLKETVKSLKAQLEPAEKATQDQEQLLDDLYQLQQKRLSQIHEHGIDVTFGASEKSFKCLKTDNQDIVYFPTRTNIFPGTHIKSGSDLVGIVKSIDNQAGRILATIWIPRQTAQEFTATKTLTGTNIKQTGFDIPCKVAENTMTFYGRSFPAGSILKCSDMYFEITGSYTNEGLVVHRVKSYADPSATKMTIPRFSKTEISDMPRNYSMYNNRVM